MTAQTASSRRVRIVVRRHIINFIITVVTIIKETGKDYAPRIATAAKETGLKESQIIDWVKRQQKVAKRDSD